MKGVDHTSMKTANKWGIHIGRTAHLKPVLFSTIVIMIIYQHYNGCVRLYLYEISAAHINRLKVTSRTFECQIPIRMQRHFFWLKYALGMCEIFWFFWRLRFYWSLIFTTWIENGSMSQKEGLEIQAQEHFHTTKERISSNIRRLAL